MTGEARSASVWPEESVECRRAYRFGIWGRFGESGQASLNACGVCPVHRRKDPVERRRLGILKKERDIADAQAAILKESAREVTPHLVEDVAE